MKLIHVFGIKLIFYICLVNAQQLLQQQQPLQQQPLQQQPLQQQRPILNQQAKESYKPTLYNSKECFDDISKYCPKKGDQMSDFAVLRCIYNEVKDLSVIDKECHHLLYSYKKNLTQNLRLDASALNICKQDIEKLKECQNVGAIQGHLLSCLLDNLDNVTVGSCKTFLTNVEALVFTDYRLVYKFQEYCNDDISRLQCGRLDDNDEAPTEQGKTIECLQTKVDSLTDQCKTEIYKISQMQSEDFHLDRSLYFACKDDRDKLCETVVSGKGQVFKCLSRNRFNPLMSKPCQEQVTRRLNLIIRSPAIDKNFITACKSEMVEHKCLTKFKLNGSSVERLSSVLVCLESAARDGKKINAECRFEILEHRRNLLSDYKLNPGVVTFCSAEIDKYCGGGVERGGKTLHCLFRNAKLSAGKANGGFNKSCLYQLKRLIKTADAAEDVRVDPDLYQACKTVIDTSCKDIEAGSGRIIQCLLKQRGTSQMTDQCDERLVEIEFFVARDWNLDPALYQACKKDALSYCNAKVEWKDWSSEDKDDGALVLPCLYHLVYNNDEDDEDDDNGNNASESSEKPSKVSAECATEVKRVMQERAKSIDLIPEVQENCAYDLQSKCSDVEVKKKGEELRCLQKNFKSLEEDECRKAIRKYTKYEAKDIRLDQILMKSCKPIINQNCADNKDDKGDLLECLIKQKNNPNMDEKCKAGIAHHQLVNLEDVAFNFKFNRDCLPSINNYCVGRTKKTDVVKCLSDTMLADTLLDRKQRIEPNCRKQLKFELLQMNEDLRLDPDLYQACKVDVEQLCGNVRFGKGQVLECLKSQKDLTNGCKKLLFQRQSIDLRMQNADYRLQDACGTAAKALCVVSGEADYIPCLRRHLLDPKLDEACRRVVINRIVVQNKDARLNPELWQACRRDASEHCVDEFSALEKGEELNGRVIKCLKHAFVEKKLAKKCEIEVEQIMREAANVDYRLDPLLTEACFIEVEQFCSDEPDDEKEDCLRLKFQHSELEKDTKCYDEVKRIILEGAADIFTDRLLLKACAQDLNRLCEDVAPGAAQQLKCLLTAQESSKKKKRLTDGCQELLSSRKELWYLADVSDDIYGIQDLVDTINQSHNRAYLLFVLSAIVLLIFALGCLLRPAVRYQRLTKLK